MGENLKNSGHRFLIPVFMCDAPGAAGVSRVGGFDPALVGGLGGDGRFFGFLGAAADDLRGAADVPSSHFQVDA